MITAIILFAIGMGLLYTTYAVSKKYDTLLKNGERAEGIIFDFEGGGPDNPDMPVIRFVTAQQEWITKASNISLPHLKKGAKVTVLYDPQNPSNFVVKSSFSYLMVSLLAIAGIAAILAGVYHLLFIPGSLTIGCMYYPA
jgi:hypothetical protein